MIAAWPAGDEAGRDREAEAQMDALMELIGAVRTLRSEYEAAPAAMIRIHLSNVSAELASALAVEGRVLERLARVEHVETGGSGAHRAGAHAVLRDGTELFVPLAGLIDVERERERLTRELERLDGQLRATESRLENRDFVERAPTGVVERERDKAASFRDQRERLSVKLSALG